MRGRLGQDKVGKGREVWGRKGKDRTWGARASQGRVGQNFDKYVNTSSRFMKNHNFSQKTFSTQFTTEHKSPTLQSPQ